MATWGGNELPARNALQLRNRGVPELPDEWNFPGPWEDAEPDYMPKPGQKGYDPRQQMASARLPSPPPPANSLLRFSQDQPYWLANTPSTFPPNVWGDYLNWLAGRPGAQDEGQ